LPAASCRRHRTADFPQIVGRGAGPARPNDAHKNFSLVPGLTTPHFQTRPCLLAGSRAPVPEKRPLVARRAGIPASAIKTPQGSCFNGIPKIGTNLLRPTLLNGEEQRQFPFCAAVHVRPRLDQVRRWANHASSSALPRFSSLEPIALQGATEGQAHSRLRPRWSFTVRLMGN